MASSTLPLQSIPISTTTLLFLFFFISPTNAQLPSSSSRPHGVILPVTKDYKTLQYLTKIKQRTPLVNIDLVVDIGGEFLWVDCEQGYISSSYRPAHCESIQCKLAQYTSCGDCSLSLPQPGCNNNTCHIMAHNPLIRTAGSSEVTSDVMSVQSTNGSNPGPNVRINRLLFGCGGSYLLAGLSKGVKGMAGLGRNTAALHSLFASVFRFPRKFALCLSSRKGVIFFGDGPYVLLPGIDVSHSLSYTPLLVNPVRDSGVLPSKGEHSAEYFIGVKSIKIDGAKVPLNKTLMSINKKSGVGGTKISTLNAYTVMETSIYNAFTRVFIKKAAAMNISRVASVAPFGACFSMGNLKLTRVGFRVPRIDLVLQNKRVTWSIFGSNSVVQARNGVLCLAFVDGGSEPKTSIVIGGYQLEDNLLQFDLPRSRLGFSLSLLFKQTTCSNFNFTTVG